MTQVASSILLSSLSKNFLTGSQRGQYLRVIMAEIEQHKLYIVSVSNTWSLGHSTMFMWPTADRELFVDLGDMACIKNHTCIIWYLEGVRSDIPSEFKNKTFEFIDYFEKRLNEYDKIFYNNPLFRQRSEGIGILRRQDAIDFGTTGSVIRASGVDYDVRKKEPYEIYDKMDFEVVTMNSGDSFARSILPIYDLRQSIQIIRQCLKDIPEGSFRSKTSSYTKRPSW